MSTPRNGQLNTADTEENLSYFARMKRWMKKHPILTSAIIGGLIVAAVFTGGAILAPVALAVMANIGAYITTIGFAILAACICSVVGSALHRSSPDGGKSDWAGPIIAIAAVFAAAFGGASLCIAVPLVGVVACGLVATAVGGALIGAFSWIAQKCFGQNEKQVSTATAATTNLPSPSSNAHRSVSNMPIPTLVKQKSNDATHSTSHINQTDQRVVSVATPPRITPTVVLDDRQSQSPRQSRCC
jgi:hypothetical protein